MHTLLGLLELEMYDDAVEFAGEVAGDHRVTAEQITERTQDRFSPPAGRQAPRSRASAEWPRVWDRNGSGPAGRPRGLERSSGTCRQRPRPAAGRPRAVEVELQDERRPAVPAERAPGMKSKRETQSPPYARPREERSPWPLRSAAVRTAGRRRRGSAPDERVSATVPPSRHRPIWSSGGAHPAQ
ncbi:hypothetical protein STENM327S_01733 [Streptomyces tendae]